MNFTIKSLTHDFITKTASLSLRREIEEGQSWEDNFAQMSITFSFDESKSVELGSSELQIKSKATSLLKAALACLSSENIPPQS